MFESSDLGYGSVFRKSGLFWLIFFLKTVYKCKLCEKSLNLFWYWKKIDKISNFLSEGFSFRVSTFYSPLLARQWFLKSLGISCFSCSFISNSSMCKFNNWILAWFSSTMFFKRLIVASNSASFCFRFFRSPFTLPFTKIVQEIFATKVFIMRMTWRKIILS